MKQIRGSETNAAFTSAVNESGDFRCWHVRDIPTGSDNVPSLGQTGRDGNVVRMTSLALSNQVEKPSLLTLNELYSAISKFLFGFAVQCHAH